MCEPSKSTCALLQCKRNKNPTIFQYELMFKIPINLHRDSLGATAVICTKISNNKCTGNKNKLRQPPKICGYITMHFMQHQITQKSKYTCTEYSAAATAPPFTAPPLSTCPQAVIYVKSPSSLPKMKAQKLKEYSIIRSAFSAFSQYYCTAMSHCKHAMCVCIL